RTAKFDLTLNATEEGNILSLNFEYCTKIFKEATIRRFITYLKGIMQAVTEAPHQKISEIEIITEEEKTQILYQFNDTATEYPWDKTVHQLFEQQVEKTPEAVAVTGPCIRRTGTGQKAAVPAVPDKVTLTYTQLNREANRQARYLIAKGAGKDDTVGILMERSIDMLTAVLAVWKAGSAYIPLDPHTPVQRITGVLKDSGTKILVTHPQHVTHLLNETYTHTVICPEMNSTGEQEKHGNPGIKLSMQDLAYVIYTSGSTGKPK
ncbi:MAG: AMP-binding protein, partial [bacterium]|nr:AMP-binding protein [bacterium]